MVHGACKTSAQKSGWDIHKTLTAMWKIFQDSPARRETYSRTNETDVRTKVIIITIFVVGSLFRVGDLKLLLRC